VNSTRYSYDASTQTLKPLATFGAPSGTAGPRIIQLAAKIIF